MGTVVEKAFRQVAAAIGIFILSSLCPAKVCAADPLFTTPAPLPAYSTHDDGTGNQAYPQLASDGGQNLVVAWNTVDANDWTAGRSNDVFTAKSDDYGATWSVPKSIFSGEVKLVSVSHTDAAWVIVWYHAFRHFQTGPDLSQVGPRILDLYSARSTDGKTWSKPDHIYSGPGVFNDVKTAGDDNVDPIRMPPASRFFGDVESDGDSTIIISLGRRMLRSSNGGLGWSLESLSDAGKYENIPHSQIAAAGNGKWYLMTGADYYHVDLFSSEDDGATWSGPTQPTISFRQPGGTETDVPIRFVDIAARGNTIVATGYPGIYTSVDGGATWTGELRNSDSLLPQDVAVSGDGNWVIATQQFDDLPEDDATPPQPDSQVIVLTSSDPAKGWSLPVVVNPSLERTANPAVQPMGDEGFALAYQSNALEPGSLAPDSDIIVSFKTDAAADWSAAVQANPSEPAEFPQMNDSDVLLENGDNGIVLAAWAADVDDQDGIDQIMIARSDYYGKTWSDAVVVTSPYSFGGRDISDHNLVYAGFQRWVVSWQVDYTTRYSLSDDNGITWSAPQELNGDEIAANGNGTVIKYVRHADFSEPESISRLPAGSDTWEEPITLPTSIYNPSGSVLMANTGGQNWCLIGGWLVGGVYTSTDDGRSWTYHVGTNLPRLARFDVDENGNIVAIDARFETGNGYKIYVTRSINNGVDWSTPVLVSTEPSINISDPNQFIFGDIAYLGDNIWVICLNTSEYALSMDGGVTWSITAGLPFGRIGLYSRPAIAAKNGRIVFAWQAEQEGEFPDIDTDVLYSFSSFAPAAAAMDWQIYE